MNPDPIQNESAEAIPAQTAPTTAGMTTKVVKGSLWTLAGQVAPLGVSFFTTPFVIRLLGSEGYGVLILVGLIPTYFAFADLGMGIASTKFASEAYAAGDAKREASTVHTAAAMSFILSVPVAALIFIFSNFAVGLFNVPEHLRGEANIALKIASVTFVINFLNSIFNTPQLTRLRMDLNTFVSSGFRMLGLIATPITIYLGGGIVGAIAILLCVSLLTLAANIAVSGKLLKELFAFSLDRNAIRPMLKVGGAYAVSTVAALALGGSEKFILTHATSVKDLAYYSVAFTIATMLTMFSGSMTQSLIPAFSQMQSDADRARRISIYSRCIRIVLIAFLPTLVFVALIARPFLTLWAGTDFGIESVAPLHILMFGLLMNAVAFFPVSVIIATGRTDTLAKLYWIELLFYIPLVFWLVSMFGAKGAAAAWSIRVATDAVILFYLAKRISAVTIGNVRPFAAIAFAIIITPFILVQFYDVFKPVMLLITLISFTLYAIVAWTTLLDRDEVAWMKQRLLAVRR